MAVLGLGPDVTFPMIAASLAYAFDLYDGDHYLGSGSAQGGAAHPGPVVVDPINKPVVGDPMPTHPITGTFGDPHFGTAMTGRPIIDLNDPIMGAFLGLGVLPLMGLIGGMLLSLGRPLVLPLAKNSLVRKLAMAAGMGELLDISTPSIDLPSVSDIPGALATIPANTWEVVNSIVDLPRDIFGQFFGFGGDAPRFVPEDTEGHGPIVKMWRAPEPDGVPFVLTQQGWIGARRLNGTWSWYKPKKPMVITPGIPLDARQARKLALIYKREKRKAAKVFGLVERKPKSSAKNGMRVVRTGHGDDVVVIND
jgi:hypothetical protein